MCSSRKNESDFDRKKSLSIHIDFAALTKYISIFSLVGSYSLGGVQETQASFERYLEAAQNSVIYISDFSIIDKRNNTSFITLRTFDYCVRIRAIARAKATL